MADVLTKNNISSINLYDSLTNAVILSNLGTVNYNTGTISITSLNPAGYLENSEDIRIYAVPASLDLFTTRDLILVIDDSLQDVTLGIETGLTINVSQE
jgi:hypothetical protein